MLDASMVTLLFIVVLSAWAFAERKAAREAVTGCGCGRGGGRDGGRGTSQRLDPLNPLLLGDSSVTP